MDSRHGQDGRSLRPNPAAEIGRRPDATACKNHAESQRCQPHQTGDQSSPHATSALIFARCASPALTRWPSARTNFSVQISCPRCIIPKFASGKSFYLWPLRLNDNSRPRRKTLSFNDMAAFASRPATPYRRQSRFITSSVPRNKMESQVNSKKRVAALNLDRWTNEYVSSSIVFR